MRKNHHSPKLILSDDVSSPVFILVRPQMAENIGMAARAMMNCGLWRMRLVSPKENHLDERAINASSGADEILKRAEVFSDLSDALSDLQYVVATTARVRGMEKDVLSAEDMMKNIKNQHLDISSVGIMFGCERTRLENDELALADSLLTVPLNALHPSLNLSQAVLLTAYEYMKCFSNIKNTVSQTPRASREKVEKLLLFLQNELTERGHFHELNKKPRMVKNMNNIFIRAGLTDQEVQTLYGVFRSLTNKKTEE